jgi:nitroimidazol reductase NimA-like FMN-containing flavoprotein (pyridoxamine 5'-phosphate oxidase superfamily)
MMGTVSYQISELPHDAAIALLERNHVGRLAFAFRDRVDIEPISYVYHKGWLYARTSPGTKLTTVHHQPYIAFEVDEILDKFHWKSVVLHGTIYFIDPDRSPADKDAYETALKVLRSVDTSVLTSTDATPHRREFFRIHVDEVVGRKASP